MSRFSLASVALVAAVPMALVACCFALGCPGRSPVIGDDAGEGEGDGAVGEGEGEGEGEGDDAGPDPFAITAEDCGNNVDDDGDERFDCDDSGDCRRSPLCAGGAVVAGGACASHADCASAYGHDALCAEGLCLELCTPGPAAAGAGAAVCSGDAACISFDFGSTEGLCVDACLADGDCVPLDEGDALACVTSSLAGTSVCSPVESCGDFTSVDLDGLFDCEDPDCTDDAACAVGPAPFGAPCAAANECASPGGTEPVCASTGCSAACDDDDDCGAAGLCFPRVFASGRGLCLGRCAVDADCPAAAGVSCTFLSVDGVNGENVCLPSAASVCGDGDVTFGEQCDPPSAVCDVTCRFVRAGCAEPVTFPDAAVDAAVRDVLDVADDVPLAQAALDDITFLTVSGAGDLTNVPCVRNLQNLTLGPTKAPQPPLDPLAGAPAADGAGVVTFGDLRSLAIQSTTPIDFAPLSVPLAAALPRLGTVNFSAPVLPDLAPLAALPQLRTVIVNVPDGVDIAALGAALPRIEELAVLSVVDDAAIAALTGAVTLESLGVAPAAPLPNVDVLAPLDRLRRLDITGGAGVAGVGGVERFRDLQVLFVSGPVTDLTPLASLSGLAVVGISRSNVTELTALSSLPRLAFVDISGTVGVDLAGLVANPRFQGFGAAVFAFDAGVDCATQSVHFEALRARGVALLPHPCPAGALLVRDLEAIELDGAPGLASLSARCRAAVLCEANDGFCSLFVPNLGSVESGGEPYVDGTEQPPFAVPVALHAGAGTNSLMCSSQFTFAAGDHIDLVHDGGVVTSVALPVFTGADITLFVGADGASYFDAALTQPAAPPAP